MKLNGVNYTRQLTTHDCTSTAFVNACKYYGLNISYRKKYKVFYEYFRTTPTMGTRSSRIKYVANRKFFPFKVESVKEQLNFGAIDQHLNKGGTAILSLPHTELTNHAFFLFKKDAKYYGINYNPKYAISVITPEAIMKDLKKGSYSLGIFLVEKEENS